VSGTIPWGLRPQGRRLLERLAAGDNVIAVRFDRVFRDASDGIETVPQFHRRGIVFHFIGEGGQYVPTAAGKLMVNVLGAISADERRRIVARVKAAKRYARTVGYYMGGRAPLGYRTDADGRPLLDPAGRLIEDEEMQGVKELVRGWRGEGMAIRQIQQRLAERGVRWSRGAIHTLCRQAIALTAAPA
jgi:DNA invertase Pin-like site-specific DNA recombinase